MRFRAAVLHAPAQALRIEENDLGALRSGDVVVRMLRGGHLR